MSRWVSLNQARRSEEHTSELQSRGHLVCRLLLEKKKQPLPQRKVALKEEKQACRNHIIKRTRPGSGNSVFPRPLQSGVRRPCQTRLVFFNDTATPEIYTLSLPDALPI